MRLCDCWPLTNRLLFAAHNRDRRAARCPCVRLLYMTNSGWFCWYSFGLHRTADFRLLCMKMIPRRRFFCAGFLCSLYIGAAALLLWLKFWLVLLRQFWPYAYILHALARLFFNRRGVGNCRAFRRFCCGGRLCGLLDIHTRYWWRYVLRPLWF